MDERLREALLNKSVDMRIGCAEARRIAEELGVPYAEVGQAADALGIRIRGCELGCF